MESAILVTLQPGAYTAIVRGKNGATGVGLVEVYDVEHGSTSILANISTRGLVDTDQGAMIGGVILQGTDSAGILFRAIGPSLGGQGIETPLSNPTMELFDVQGQRLAFNDNWRESQEEAIQETGVAPVDDAESAILATLTRGLTQWS